MRIAAAVFADFVEAPRGVPSRLQAPLAGATVIEHTLRRVARIEGLERRCLVVQPRDEPAAAQAVQRAGLTTAVEVLAIDDGRRPRRELLTAARKWCLDGWRGGLMGATWFDEFVEPLAAARAFNQLGCDALLCLEGHQAGLDPAIASAMVRHAREHEADARFVFTQAPPGLAGVLLGRECLRELVQNHWPLGVLLSYRPEMPLGDPITRPPCLQIDGAVAQTRARLAADTRRACELLEAAFAAHGADADAGAICAASRAAQQAGAGVLPIEVELELTTDDPLPQSALRPRGGRVPRRILNDLGAVRRVAGELAAWDDRLIVLGGHGDPLLHPAFGQVLSEIRAAGVCGLAVVTPLVELSPPALEALFAERVDVVEVLLDANTPETYRAVHGADRFADALANVERLLAARRERQRARPLVVCSLTRCAATLGDLEAFFDRWVVEAGSAVIRGYNDYCGALAPDALLPATPLVRGACRRLARSMMLLADGTVPYCAQDFAGRTRVGDWTSRPLTEIWQGPELTALRRRHAAGQWDGDALCRVCGEWDRAA